ncbi:MAG: protein kinase [Rickettsiales bacterium]|jgi:serine/threonine protein kinase|nr:protein kinase [Rickettsiales bacterium]
MDEERVQERRVLESLRTTIKNNPGSLKFLSDNLSIDPSKHTINGEKVTKLGEGTYGTVYKIHCMGQAMALKVSKKPQNGNCLVSKALADKDKKPRAVMDMKYTSPDGRIIVTELCKRNWGENRSKDIALMEKSFIPILSAVDTLHNNGIVHGDIKSNNILVREEEGDLVLCDFGSATKCDADGFGDSGPGTICYEAPEKWSSGGDGKINLKACDSWALGITFCEKILGENPYYIFAKEYLKTDINKLHGPEIKLIFQFMNKSISEDHKLWEDFLEEKLDRVEPPLGTMLSTVVLGLLDPDRKNAQSIGRMLEFIEKNVDLENQRVEYDRLHEKSTERETAEGPEKMREQEKGEQKKQTSGPRGASPRPLNIRVPPQTPSRGAAPMRALSKVAGSRAPVGSIADINRQPGPPPPPGAPTMGFRK